MDVPRRQFDATITAHGDSRKDLCALLRHFADCIEAGSNSVVTGGCSSGGILAVAIDETMTPDRFQEALTAYLERIRESPIPK